MRIRTIELAWFRGAAGAIALEPNGKSMVVYGENGSGKSSFVDAVEYALNNGSIEHLRTEYSGSRQVNAIPNTHKPANVNSTLRFKFQDSSELKIEFNSNGSSKRSGGEGIAMGEWEYRQTVLRQDEVAKFIHDTKGGKYSALLPLFGLHKLEVAAENLRKLRRTVENEAKSGEKRPASNSQLTCARLPSQIRATNKLWKLFTGYTRDIAVETAVRLTRFHFVAKQRLP
jgi:DNA repair exonuclease SbcCD ATPase subunit